MPERFKLHIAGIQRPALEPQEVSLSPLLKVTLKGQAAFGMAARGAQQGGGQITQEIDPETDVVELEFENGVHQWISGAQLREDLRVRNSRLTRGENGQDIVVPADLGVAPTRGIPELMLKGLKVFGIDPAGSLANLATREVISKFEDTLNPPPGLYRLRDPRSVDSQITDAQQLDSTGPYLVFLHGTASSIDGSFSGLAPSPGEGQEDRVPPEDWEALQKLYPKRILALQHKTFSESPVKNASDVAQLLPSGARLHVVSHSRGGLIGELLCLQELNDSHFASFRNAAQAEVQDVNDEVRQEIQAARTEEIENIKELSKRLQEKVFKVEKFVRVACPARGTVLASKRMDLYLSVLLNLFELIPLLKNSTLYALLKTTTLELCRRKADPRQLPGIEAMMPESPLIHLLNQDALTSTADLAVVSGDLAPGSLWQRLKTLAVELFYLQPNDLVVNTIAMYGGMERRKTASYFFNKGPHVNHFHYFSNPGTRSRIRSWLEATTGSAVEGFKTFTPHQKKFQADARRGESKRPILFFLPDLLASSLKDRENGSLIWLSRAGLARRGRDQLSQFPGNLEPSELLPNHYSQLINDLQGDFQVERFSYDWRASLLDIKEQLRSRVQECIGADRSVNFLAHGVGGLLVRLLASDPVWNDVAARGGRLVMMGTPSVSCSFAATLLWPNSAINRMLNMVDQESKIDAAQMFRSFTSILELLPDRFDNVFHLTPSEQQPRKSFRAQLENGSKVFKSFKNVAYVAGAQERTPFAVEPPRNGASGSSEPQFMTTSAGDGHVTWAECALDELAAFQIKTAHGSLADYPLAFGAIRELLSRGSTEKLPRLLFAPEVPDAAPLLGSEPLFYPTDDDLADCALGATSASPFEEPEHPITISVSHGHLRHANYPVMVGHYEDDTIVSAEKVLDKCLGGRLADRLLMGVYPGSEGSSELILCPNCRPVGALVVGLGEVGDVTPEKLRRSVTSAILRYALQLTENPSNQGEERLKANLSPLLIGAYGELTTRESILAIIQGALDANRQLSDTKGGKNIRVEELEFVELFKDIAVQAAHDCITIAWQMNSDLPSGQVLRAFPTVTRLDGGQPARPLDPHTTGWWRRIQVEENEDGRLEYTVLTDRAQATEDVQVTQRKLVDRLINKVVGSAAYNEDCSATLYQLLVPRGLRNKAQDKTNLVLVLDANTAHYPWELLAQRTGSHVQPLATECGLIRQFKSKPSEEGWLHTPIGEPCALIVGDTKTDLPPLPKAEEEGRIVMRRLQGKYKARLLGSSHDGATIVSNLVETGYRIIHLAGHGQYDPDKPEASGMKIDTDLFLTPDLLESLTAAPDLVFVNCCHLGGISPTAGVPGPRLAASFAAKLMSLGVRAVVAAGWAVDDSAALVFADRFYERMLDGNSFGESVLAARQHTQQLFPEKNTWGAYQCYGNPDFRLERTTRAESAVGQQPTFVDRSEILLQLDKLAAMVADSSGEDLQKQIAQLAEQTPVSWRDGEVLAAFGKVYSEMRDFPQAIACFQQALEDEKSSASIKAILDCANNMDRRASDLQRQVKELRTSAAQTKAKDESSKLDSTIDDYGKQISFLTEAAIRQLEDVGKLVHTAEHASLLGGFYKRRGEAADDLEARIRAWTDALTWYERAFLRRKETNNDELYYPGLNAATLAWLLLSPDKEKWIGVVRESALGAGRCRKSVREFWSRAGVADAFLLDCLWNDTPNREKEIIAAYSELSAEYGTARELDSVIKQLDFVLHGLPKDLQQYAQLLERVRESLR